MKDINYKSELCDFISKKYPKDILKLSSIPKSFVGNINSIKAIILGADPSNPKTNLEFKYAFGLENENSPYFQIIKENLKLIGLSLNELYVQNIIQNYMIDETEKNHNWNYFALLWIGELKRELDENINRNIPIIITAQKILKSILNTDKMISPNKIYSNKIIFDNSTNFFNRDIICLFRHQSYQLKRWEDYKNYLQGYFKKTV